MRYLHVLDSIYKNKSAYAKGHPEIQNGKIELSTLQKNLDAMLQAKYKAVAKTQAAYDSAVYNYPKLFPTWQKRIISQLDSLKEFEVAPSPHIILGELNGF
jgi:hypothetical protein